MQAVDGRCGATQGGSTITVKPANEASAAAGRDGSSEADRKTLQLSRHEWCGRWVLPSTEFSAAMVGAKSLNTQRLQVRTARCDHRVEQSASFSSCAKVM